MSVDKAVNAVSSANDGDTPPAPLTSSAQHITPLPHWARAQTLWAEADVQRKIWIGRPKLFSF